MKGKTITYLNCPCGNYGIKKKKKKNTKCPKCGKILNRVKK